MTRNVRSESCAVSRTTRREFIGTMTGLGVAALMPGALRTAHSARLEKIGLQLYTVRDQMKADFEGTIARVAEVGYNEVEFAGYFNHSPAEVRAILDRTHDRVRGILTTKKAVLMAAAQKLKRVETLEGEPLRRALAGDEVETERA